MFFSDTTCGCRVRFERLERRRKLPVDSAIALCVNGRKRSHTAALSESLMRSEADGRSLSIWSSDADGPDHRRFSCKETTRLRRLALSLGWTRVTDRRRASGGPVVQRSRSWSVSEVRIEQVGKKASTAERRVLFGLKVQQEEQNLDFEVKRNTNVCSSPCNAPRLDTTKTPLT
jgi:hypothetical protein